MATALPPPPTGPDAPIVPSWDVIWTNTATLFISTLGWIFLGWRRNLILQGKHDALVARVDQMEENFSERLERIENKVDRLIERIGSGASWPRK